MTVHILEDDLAVCDALSTFVEQMGHTVRTYGDAETFFAAGVPSGDDTVIVDIGLPGIDGTKVVSWVNALADAPRVLVITGQSQTMIRDFLQGQPAIQLLRKPLSATQLAGHL